MIERGGNEDHDKMKGKDKGQLVVVKEEKRGRMATSKKVNKDMQGKGYRRQRGEEKSRGKGGLVCISIKILEKHKK
jgi:hypothetical protein